MRVSSSAKPATAARGIALGAVLVLSLAGCGLVGSGSAPAPRATSTTSSALDSLQPVIPKKLTTASLKTSTDNLAKQIDSLVASADIVYIDNHEKVIAQTSSAGASYAVLRTINVAPALDPIQQATAMEKLLLAAGWKLEDSTSKKGSYIAALSSSPDPSVAWFLLLGGDSTVPKQPVVTVQLASPDLPRT